MPLFGRHKMTDPVEGSAKVVNVNTIPNVSDLAQRCTLDVVIEAPGITAVPTSLTVRVNSNRWPSRDQLLPVLIDRANPEHVEVMWDRVPTFEELRQQARAKRLSGAVAETAGRAASPPEVSGAAGSATHVLEAGLPAQVVVRHAQRLGMQNPQGLDMYALTLSVTIEGRQPYDVSVGNPVPPDGVAMLGSAAPLPARVLADNPQAVVIDWGVALAH
jgi:hypothetical protein